MSYAPLISKILLSFILTSSILYRYGNWFRHHIIVTLTVLIAWYFSFLIIFALPLDIISVSQFPRARKLIVTRAASFQTVFRQCLEQNVHINETLLVVNDETVVSNPLACEEPWSNVPEKVFPNLWRTVYWSMQLLTWCVCEATLFLFR